MKTDGWVKRHQQRLNQKTHPLCAHRGIFAAVIITLTTITQAPLLAANMSQDSAPSRSLFKYNHRLCTKDWGKDESQRWRSDWRFCSGEQGENHPSIYGFSEDFLMKPVTQSPSGTLCLPARLSMATCVCFAFVPALSLPLFPSAWVELTCGLLPLAHAPGRNHTPVAHHLRVFQFLYKMAALCFSLLDRCRLVSVNPSSVYSCFSLQSSYSNHVNADYVLSLLINWSLSFNCQISKFLLSFWPDTAIVLLVFNK